MVHQDDLNNTVVKSTHFKSYRNKILRMSSQHLVHHMEARGRKRNDFITPFTKILA